LDLDSTAVRALVATLLPILLQRGNAVIANAVDIRKPKFAFRFQECLNEFSHSICIPWMLRVQSKGRMLLGLGYPGEIKRLRNFERTGVVDLMSKTSRFSPAKRLWRVSHFPNRNLAFCLCCFAAPDADDLGKNNRMGLK
jgi:hypothetical protein